MADQKGFMQKVIGSIGNLISWTIEKMQNTAFRDSVLLDLGLDPSEENEFPESSIDNINAYRNAINPDKEALTAAIQDLKAFYRMVKEYILLWGFSDSVDEYGYRFFEFMGSHYIRTTYPKRYYLFQLLGFLVQSRLTVEGAVKREGANVANIWNLLTDPLGYIVNFPENMRKSGWLRLDSTEDAEANSAFFLLLNLIVAITDENPNMRFLFGWDRLPRAFNETTKSEFRSSYRGGNLLAEIQGDPASEFPGPPGATDNAWWDYIEGTVNKEQPTDQDKVVSDAFLLAVERWKRGEWEDNISETAYSFDFELPDADNSNLTSFLGGTLFWVSAEDFPTDLIQNNGTEIVPAGGLFASLNGELNYKYPVQDDWKFGFKTSSGDLMDLFLGQNSDIHVLGDMEAKLELKKKRDKDTGATYQLPNADGTRFAVGEIKISTKLGVKDVGLEIGLKENAFIFSAKEADSFLRKVMPPGEVPLKFSMVAGLSKKKGFYIKHDIDILNDILDPEEPEQPDPEPPSGGEAPGQVLPQTDERTRAMDLKFPIHKKMGVVDFKKVQWSVGKTDRENMLGGKLSITTTVTSKLGPVFIQVEKIGMKMEVVMPEEGGNLENMDLDLGFLPPRGVGLRIEAEAISGGGFLELDWENHRYAGVLALNFLDLELVAVGLINTRLPNNQPGFSMLISIGVIFDPPFQLPYQFTLNGVGGLVGINRTMKVDVLQDRIRDGAITSIMFPRDVIENAPKIISDLRAIFPPEEGHTVVAPFLKIGWGTSTILEVDLGIFLEFPFSGRLILLGGIGIYLPNKEVEERLVEIHIDVFGDFNFAESYVLIEGRLRDSQIEGVTLTGGFAFVLDWGAQPQFLMSVGGYHPRYKKPARFPDIPRLTAQINKGDDIRVSCKYYQAITSNSYQIGFSADLLVKKGKAVATGYFEMNALLQFDPLYFEFDIKISIRVAYRSRTFAGVDLEFLLSGPKPWRATGFAKIKILFFSLKIKFNYSWGGEQEIAPVTVTAAKLLSDLKIQLAEQNNWTGKLPLKYSRAEALRSVDAPEDQGQILVHPGGYLELRQTLIPLNRKITKLGNSKVTNDPVYRIDSYQFGNGQAINVGQDGTLMEHFARAQYEFLSDEEKISAADFELMAAGVNLVNDQTFDLATVMESTGNDFEDIILGDPSGEKQVKSSYNWQEKRSRNLTGSRRAVDANRPEEVFGLVDTLPETEPKTFEIVSKTTLERPEKLGDQYFQSYAAAKDYLEDNWKDGWKDWQIREAIAEEAGAF